MQKITQKDKISSERVGAKISAISEMIATMITFDVPLEKIKQVVAFSHGLSLKDFTEWNSKDVSRRTCLMIRETLKKETEDHTRSARVMKREKRPSHVLELYDLGGGTYATPVEGGMKYLYEKTLHETTPVGSTCFMLLAPNKELYIAYSGYKIADVKESAADRKSVV